MKLLELIRLLWQLYEKHGNLSVYVECDGQDHSIEHYSIEHWAETKTQPEHILIS